MTDRTPIKTRRSPIALGIMLLLSGAAVMAAKFALPLDRQSGTLGLIAVGLALSGAIIYVTGLQARAREIAAAEATARAAAIEAARQAGDGEDAGVAGPQAA